MEQFPPAACAVWASVLSLTSDAQVVLESAMRKFSFGLLATSVVAPLAVGSVSITDIQGAGFRSSFAGQTVHNLTGTVTAKGSNGFYLIGESAGDVRVSNGLFVFSSSAAVLNQVAVGDAISLSGNVSEFRASTRPNDLTMTEITGPNNIVVVSTNNTVTPIILGKDRSPPTQHLSALDVGKDGFLSVPNNSSLVDSTKSELQPDKFGLDFWESLEGQLVTIPKPVALNFETKFGEFWVRGDWPVTGLNARGSLSITIGPDGLPDANPETVIIGTPLDGTKNPKVAVGVPVSDITGVVAYQFGFFYVIPLTAPTVLSRPDSTVPPTTLTTTKNSLCDVTIGDYNVENLAPTSSHLKTIADHISTFLKTPDLVFVQEIQDNSGPTDDGVVSANVTLSTLTAAIANISGVQYDFVEIAPIDKQDGGQPGGNIRQAYLYRSEKLKLVRGSPAGGALDATAVKPGPFGRPSLSFNPGRIEPNSSAWASSRKPLAAVWETPRGARLFTVNLHLTSKSGSASTQGDARPFVNLGVDQRTAQIETVATFVKSILAKDPHANVVVGGDCNEFFQTRSAFASFKGKLTQIDEAAGVPQEERYTYVFDQNTEQLDHIFISKAIRARRPRIEHIHVNNWAPSFAARTSDHDPSVAKIRVC
ncbi:hypothetical protein HGRIS_005712 [Hohenbuehelia grisea]|uniref:Endonuclease/exonuclease/phosphatase domain-containing protein n=1 Tax=Hohenbuehelia grisea TaxID=104357 RepID=A0ABR3JYJ7_9AGAR